ncbi:MAG: DivIVA domain-containing protein [candidate division Zixibacteria bacterium]|nr:DivIVA domain-containing protein [candidate division Zixibacteria bacterium]
METTPNDLRQQQFEIKFRGYNADDVEVFRDLAAAALEESRAESLKLSEENKHLKERLSHLLALEDTLKTAIIEAQKNAEVTVANAKREAVVIVQEAKLKRDEVIADLHNQMNKMVADINKIRFIRTNYLTKLKALIGVQMQTVEEALMEDTEEMRPPRDTRPADREAPEMEQQMREE